MFDSTFGKAFSQSSNWNSILDPSLHCLAMVLDFGERWVVLLVGSTEWVIIWALLDIMALKVVVNKPTTIGELENNEA